MKFPEDLQKTHVQLLILFGTLLIYLLVKGAVPVLGEALLVLILLEIALMVAVEVKTGAHDFGWKHELGDTLLALAVAVAIWIGASFLLNTGSPISAVVSCSMLPNLYRGDFVIVQGSPADAYDITMSRDEFDALLRDAPSVSWSGGNATVRGSVYSYCVYYPDAPLCREFTSNPGSVTETSGPLTFHYSQCGISYANGTKSEGPCLSSIGFRGKDYPMNFSHNVVVYGSEPGTLFSKVGDIVHRAVFRIDVGGQYYYLTKGDNNPILDAQVFDYPDSIGNAPVPQKNVKGKVLLRVPILGYYKLVISGYFQEDPQCSTLLSYEHV